MAEEEAYHPVDAIEPTVQTGAATTGAGLLVASIQATLTKQNIGMLGTFTRYGGTVATFGAVGATFEFVRIASANLREKEDSINHAIGGLIGGSILGLRNRSFPSVIGHGALVAAVMAGFDFTGGQLTGPKKDDNVDEYERKIALRSNRRRPIQETIDELGEGRGIYGPDWEERRRQRIKEKYGIDVPA